MSESLDYAAWTRLQALYGSYGRVLDSGEYALWPDFFTVDAVYKVQSRENFERGLPLAAIALESRGMLQDRVIGATDTIFHDPYYQRHVIGAPLVLKTQEGVVHSEASYLVIRTRRDSMPEILSVGRYLDQVVQTAEGLRFSQRLCIFDNDLIPNSLIYPI
ncbi:MAG: aromatic-ring-hydroxylating dioxygenase subunit beta [Lautropia sp.]|nr:aromatic-ring-hydroxylating dioxygenase subunit beta [Lautropia sp.]